jgi:hypothetical protein
MTQFDYQAALKDHPESEVAQYLATQHGVDRDAYLKDGHSDADFINEYGPKELPGAPTQASGNPSAETAPPDSPDEYYDKSGAAVLGGIAGGAPQAARFVKNLSKGAGNVVVNLARSGATQPPPSTPTGTVEVSSPPADWKPTHGGEQWVKGSTGVDLPGAQMEKAALDQAKGMAHVIGPGGELAGGEIKSGILLGPEKTTAEQLAAQKAALREERLSKLGQEAARTYLAKKAAEEAYRRANPTTLEKALEFGKAVTGKALTAAGPVLKVAGPVLGGASAAEQYEDMLERFHHDDYLRGIASGVGAAGSAASAMPFLPPQIRAAGAGVGIAAPLINYGADALYGRSGYSGGGLVGYDEGGSTKKSIAGALSDVGFVQGPNLTTMAQDYVSKLPETTAKNIEHTNWMVQNSNPYDFNPHSTTGGLNQNYDPQAAKEFAEYIPGMGVGAIKEAGGNWAANRLESSLKSIGSSIPKIDTSKNITQDAGNFIRDNFPHVDDAYNQYFKDTGLHSMNYGKDYWPWMQQNFPKEFESVTGEKTPAHAINNWIDSKLTKYVRNDLATPNDPIRQLADKGISHINNLEDRFGGLSDRLEDFREKQGFNRKGYAETDAGRTWENLADDHVYTTNIKDYMFDNPATTKLNPWISDLAAKNPNAQINDLDRTATVGLGFDHLVDELRNSIRPDTDLPQHLRLKPEALDRVTVPQAVQQVAKINAWRADQMEKASKQSLADFPVVHAGENGYNIHELKMPEKTDLPGYTFEDTANGTRVFNEKGERVNHPGGFNLFANKELAIKDLTHAESYNKLDKALKNEGTQMGHCVGGYTDDVANGYSRIFSLRDPKGGAHVTIEALPLSNGKLEINQIKGKQNGPVVEKYRSTIQDFLNSKSDELGNVSDLSNVGLIDVKNLRGKDYFSATQAAHERGEIPRFITRQHIDDFDK